jgi:hypothetical protein
LMASGETTNDERLRELEAERYREAATHALEQLDWCISYLYRIRKPGIADGIKHNRSQILKRMGVVSAAPPSSHAAMDGGRSHG